MKEIFRFMLEVFRKFCQVFSFLHPHHTTYTILIVNVTSHIWTRQLQCLIECLLRPERICHIVQQVMNTEGVKEACLLHNRVRVSESHVCKYGILHIFHLQHIRNEYCHRSDPRERTAAHCVNLLGCLLRQAWHGLARTVCIYQGTESVSHRFNQLMWVALHPSLVVEGDRITVENALIILLLKTVALDKAPSETHC